ncbi:MAG: spondin domain-containing protein [Gammaproteobacteria bacterium]
MKYLSISLMMLALGLSLSACDNHGRQTYRISMTNLTHAQALSPPGALLHRSSFSAWSVGSPASLALEQMAEGGDASALLALQPNAVDYSADAPLLPGETSHFSLSTTNRSLTHLTLATMLVNTNDAFSGINAMELDELALGHTRVVYAYALDAGTEANSELPGTIPGPADGGEGFNPDRDDVTSLVTYHGGVVSQDDGHSSSVLTETHRFIGPVMRIEITAM